MWLFSMSTVYGIWLGPTPFQFEKKRPSKTCPIKWSQASLKSWKWTCSCDLLQITGVMECFSLPKRQVKSFCKQHFHSSEIWLQTNEFWLLLEGFFFFFFKKNIYKYFWLTLITSGIVFILRPQGAKYQTSPTIPLLPYVCICVCLFQPWARGIRKCDSSRTTLLRFIGRSESIKKIKTRLEILAIKVTFPFFSQGLGSFSTDSLALLKNLWIHFRKFAATVDHENDSFLIL